MKVYSPGDKKSALCHRDGRVSVTFAYRDVPFRDGSALVRNILVGVCDTCGDAILVPAQSTPAIAAARPLAEHSMEVVLPAVFMEILDAAITRVSVYATTDFRKRLLLYFVNRYARGEAPAKDLSRFHKAAMGLSANQKGPGRRLSMKLTERALASVELVSGKGNLSKTDLIKAIVMQVHDEIVAPAKPAHLSELSAISEVIYA